MSDKSAFPEIRASIAAIMLFQVAALFARSYLQGKLTAAGYEKEIARNLSYLVVPVIEAILLWPYLRQNMTALLQLVTTRFYCSQMILTAVLLGLAARLTGWSVLIAATSFGWLNFTSPGLGTGPIFWIACPAPVALILGVMVMAIIVPIIEEIVNRGLIFGTLIRKNHYRAIILSATLFAVVHAPQGMVAAFGLGILLAIQTYSSQSLVPSVITHATYNFMRILDWICLHGVWHPDRLTTATGTVGVGAVVVGCVCLAASVWLSVNAGSGRKIHPDPAK